MNSWLFRELIKRAKRKGYFTKQDIEEVIADVDSGDGSKRYSSSTIGRRRITISSWIDWISKELGAFEVKDDKVFLK